MPTVILCNIENLPRLVKLTSQYICMMSVLVIMLLLLNLAIIISGISASRCKGEWYNPVFSSYLSTEVRK